MVILANRISSSISFNTSYDHQIKYLTALKLSLVTFAISPNLLAALNTHQGGPIKSTVSAQAPNQRSPLSPTEVPSLSPASTWEKQIPEGSKRRHGPFSVIHGPFLHVLAFEVRIPPCPHP